MENKECDHIVAYVTCTADSRSGFTTANNLEFIKKNFEIEEVESLVFCPKCGKINAPYICESGARLRMESEILQALKDYNQKTGQTIVSIGIFKTSQAYIYDYHFVTESHKMEQ